MTAPRSTKIWIVQGGIAPYRIPLFAEIANAEGVDLTVVVHADRFPGAHWEIDLATLPFKTLRLPTVRWRRTYENELYFSPAIVPFFHRERPDIVVCMGFTMPTLMLFPSLLATRTPYVIWSESTAATDSGISATKLAVRKLVARRASAFLVAGTASRQYVESLAGIRPERMFLSFNCVENAKFNAASTDAHAALVGRFARRNLICVGKLIERKGILQLLAAYRDLSCDPAFADVGLILVGEGPLSAHVTAYRKQHGLERLYAVGSKTTDEIAAYYSVANAFVLLSLADPNPLVVFEALAAGLPLVLSSRAGNAADFIRGGENGFVVDPTDHTRVVQALKSVLADLDREKAKRLSRELVARANYPASAGAFLDACHYALAR